MKSESLGPSFDRTESAVATSGLVGAVIAMAAAIVLTLRSFALGGVGDGLLWFFVIGPVVVALAYWTSMVGAWLVWRLFHHDHDR